MEDFRIWGRIERIAPNEFVVVVTAVPHCADPSGISTLVEAHSSHQDAKAALKTLMVKMGEAVAAAGNRVVDTEVDGL